MFRVNIDIEGPEFWQLSEKAMKFGMSLEQYIVFASTRYAQTPVPRTRNIDIDWVEFDHYRELNWSYADIARLWGISHSTLRRKDLKRVSR